MSKRSRDFPDQLSIASTEAMRHELIALGYLWGMGGEYNAPARNLLAKGIELEKEKMSEKQRREYDEILLNVQIRERTAKEAEK